MKVIISGSVGTGKTTVSDLLGKEMDLEVLHVNEMIYNREDIVNDDVDLNELEKILKGKDEIIIESHLLCEVSLHDTIIIFRCNPEKLKGRLKERDYDEHKLNQNVEAEAVDYCVQLAEENYDKVIQVDTTDLTTQQVCDKIVDYLETGKSDNPDFSDFLIK